VRVLQHGLQISEPLRIIRCRESGECLRVQCQHPGRTKQ
jgi:hypothetical protein